jgi:lipopolysaccharide heptosyltransferase II
MTTPALRAVKESLPGRRVTLLTSSRGAEVARMVPEIDQVMIYDAPWMKATAAHLNSEPDQKIISQLRALKFDGAIVFTVYSQNPLPAVFLCYLADIPLRAAHCRENPYQLLTDWVKDEEPERGVRHEVQRQLDLVGAIGCRADNNRISFRVTDNARAEVRSLLKKLGLNLHRPWVVIHPGASAPSRCYPPEGFAEVTRRLVTAFGYQVVFTGSAAEQELVDRIQRLASVRSYSLAGSLNLSELGALLSLTTLLISNNTGPVHMAAALGTPVVDLYALTNPQHTPWAVPNRVLFHDVPCKYCYKSVCPERHHHCLKLVEPARVVDAARDLLRETLPQFAARVST